jgi:hypothetical protein
MAYPPRKGKPGAALVVALGKPKRKPSMGDRMGGGMMSSGMDMMDDEEDLGLEEEYPEGPDEIVTDLAEEAFPEMMGQPERVRALEDLIKAVTRRRGF